MLFAGSTISNVGSVVLLSHAPEVEQAAVVACAMDSALEDCGARLGTSASSEDDDEEEEEEEDEDEEADEVEEEEDVVEEDAGLAVVGAAVTEGPRVGKIACDKDVVA
jgi:hypothetical protein